MCVINKYLLTVNGFYYLYISYFSFALIPGKCNLFGEQVHKLTVVHGRDITVTGTQGCGSHHICNQKAETSGYLFSALLHLCCPGSQPGGWYHP